MPPRRSPRALHAGVVRDLVADACGSKSPASICAPSRQFEPMKAISECLRHVRDVVA